MNIAFTLSYTGIPDAADSRAARYAIRVENERRALQNPPLAALPASTAAEIKASYSTLLLDEVNSAHAQWTQRSVANVAQEFTKAQMDAVLTNFRDRLNAGETAAQIVAATAP